MKQDQDKMEKFIQAAFCVDGCVKIVGVVDIITDKIGNQKGIMYEINDKKRGEFFVTISDAGI